MADDGSDQDAFGVLREFSSCFPWKFIKVDVSKFEQATGVTRFFNCPSLTNNIAFKHSVGDLVFLMGNEIIAVGDVFDKMLAAADYDREDWLIFSTTYDLEQRWLDQLDNYGSNLTPRIIHEASATPLQSNEYRSDVTNYLSLCHRSLWEQIGGYDERYVGGISSDDSDFVRRARKNCCKTSINEAVSLHQYHQGKSRYYDPPASVITQARWDDGVEKNHSIYHSWNGEAANPQSFPWGYYGVAEVLSNKGQSL